MLKLKAVLLWTFIYGLSLVLGIIVNVVLSLLEVGLEQMTFWNITILQIFSLYVYASLAKKVQYRKRDTFIQLIPLYGFYWTLKICYRNVKGWEETKNQKNNLNKVNREDNHV